MTEPLEPLEPIPPLKDLIANPQLAHEWFHDIAAFEKDEFKAELKLITQSKELKSIASNAFRSLPPKAQPVLTRILMGFIGLIRPLVPNLSVLQSIESFLFWILLLRTTDGLSYTDPKDLKPSLLISNHRDITCDPLLALYTLRAMGVSKQAYCAAGDNLFKDPFLAKFMRLNHTFIVRRRFRSRKESYQESQRLSAYIHYLRAKKEFVWIAQRQGRAKDGYDQTDRSLIHMLTKAEAEKPFYKVINQLRVRPVSVSYEYDPCDLDKTREVLATYKQGSYQKKHREDERQIAKGLIGQKGRVHLAYGEPLVLHSKDNKHTLTERLDKAILSLNRLMPTHLAAYRYLLADLGLPVPPEANSLLQSYTDEALSQAEQNLLKRCQKLDSVGKQVFMRLYAGSVFAKLDQPLPQLAIEAQSKETKQMDEGLESKPQTSDAKPKTSRPTKAKPNQKTSSKQTGDDKTASSLKHVDG